MRVPLDWLAEFTDLPDPVALTDRLNLGGFEDAAVEDTGPDLGAIVVGHVVEHGPHPNADRLSVCRVDVGDGDPVEVVCGAPNVAQGQKIAFAATGTLLPDGRKLKKSKIRGVVSQGMICSEQELGLSQEHEGILVLDASAPVGAPLAEVMASGSRLLEVGITPNRGDTASLLGLAREVRAFFEGPLRLPEIAPDETGAPAVDAISVAVEAPEGCHHYAARVVRGVRVGPSPEWLQRRLEDCGVRAINNIVDVTNYVLLEFGQPLHAFDLSLVRGAEIRVRQASRGEKFTALDGETRELDPRDLVIADAERAVALAGVMGGADTEVSERTADVLIESAHFHPTAVRLSARRHGLRTEASYRFERGVDREGIVRAADRAARLMAELAGGEVATGVVDARGSAPDVTPLARLDVARANQLLGTDIPLAEARSLLARLDIASEEEPAGVLRCRIPSHRNDLALQQDLVEEVARVYGYERIPTTEPLARLREAPVPRLWTLGERARDVLSGAGFLETVSLPFVGEDDAAGLRLPADDPRRRALRLANPIKEEEPWLRTQLLTSLLRLARQNRSRQLDRIRIFEVSRAFLPRGEGELPDEPLHVAALLTAPEEPPLWESRNPPPLFFEAKGVAERLLFLLGYLPSLRSDPPPYLHPSSAALLEVGGQVIGAIGELHPEVSAGYALDVPCALLDLDLSLLEGLPTHAPRYREISRQPSVRRDVAVIVDAAQPAGEILDAVRSTAGADLVSAELFDRYEGKGVPEGRVSLAFRMVFQRSDRTLTDAEVAKSTDRVVRMLVHRFGGELRSSA